VGRSAQFIAHDPGYRLQGHEYRTIRGFPSLGQLETEMTNAATQRDPNVLQSSISAGTVIVASTGSGAFQQIMLDGRHMLHADEPITAGGGDTGPGPYELLLMALGSCTSMTVHLYAARKKWPLEQVVVSLRQERTHVQDCANCEDPGSMVHRIEKRIELIGSLDKAQQVRLLEIADHCPVHRTLTSKIEIQSALVSASE
jgi:putative redox protein